MPADVQRMSAAMSGQHTATVRHSVWAMTRQRPGNGKSVSSPEPGNDRGHRQPMTDWLRSRRPENGDEMTALETCFADRHHPLTFGRGQTMPAVQRVEMG